MDKAEALKIAHQYAVEVESKFHYIKIILLDHLLKEILMMKVTLI